jgi:transposase-like protein
MSGQYTMATIAKTLGVSLASIYRHVTRFGSCISACLLGPVSNLPSWQAATAMVSSLAWH